MNIQKIHFMYQLAEEFNQLYLPIGESEEHTRAYRDVVLRGKKPQNRKLEFALNDKDTMEVIESGFGVVRCIYMYDRRDFEKIVRCMAHKCQPVIIPKTMGSIVILGVTNWRKIQEHKKMYEESGGKEWKKEFEKFTSIKDNYKESLIIISDGPYSGVNLEGTAMDEIDWCAISKRIRKFHELTHFFCLKKYHHFKEEIFDEILADSMGFLFALDFYHKELALRCLGISKERYLQGGRLENYIGLKHITKKLCTDIISVADCIDKIIVYKSHTSLVELGIYGLVKILDDIYSDSYIIEKIQELKKFHQD